MTDQNPKTEKQKFKNTFKQRIKYFVLELIELVGSLPQNSLFKIISQQLLRSGTSIGANYFEAKAASSKRDFINFFNYSLKSANESKFWLEIIIETNPISREGAKKLFSELTEISNILASSILTMKRNK